MNRRAVVVCVLAAAAGAFVARADDAPGADEVQEIIDRLHRGEMPTDAEQEKLRKFALRERDKKAAGMTFDEVMAEIDKMKKTGQPADKEKLKAWAAEMQRRVDQMKKDAADLEKALGGGKKKAKQDLHLGTVHAQVRQSARTYSKNGGHTDDEHMSVALDATYTVRFDVEDKPGGDLRITWLTVNDKIVKGHFHTEVKRDTQDPAYTENDSSTADFGFDVPALVKGALTDGELVVPKAGPRAFLYASVSVTDANKGAKNHKHRVDPDGAHDSDEDVDVYAAPCGGLLTYDGFNPDATLKRSLLPPAGMAGNARQTAVQNLPTEIRGAMQSARCGFDVARFRTAWNAGAPFKMPLTYTYVLTKTETDGDETKTATVDSSVTFDLEFGSREAELEIQPEVEDDYKDWTPRPYTIEEKVWKAFGIKKEDPDTQLTVVIRFKEKKGGEVPKGTIHLELQKVSENKGICCNYPPKDATTKKDLFFPKEQKENPDKEKLVIDDDLNAHTKEPVDSIKIKIAARDSGAYGRIVATCPERGSKAVYTKTGEDFLTIPQDEDDNHVADKWAKEKGAEGKDTKWDEDNQPSGQRFDGDGYSLYEEYRGFIVLSDPNDPTSWKHIRTDPRKKDIFVYDRDKMIREYYQPHNDTAAQLEVHYLSTELFWFDEKGLDPAYQKNPPREYRQVNINSYASHNTYGPQYAVIAILDPTLVDDKKKPFDGGCNTYLEHRNVYGLGQFEHPLREQSEIRINFPATDKKVPGGGSEKKEDQDRYKDNLKWNRETLVLHEFGHQIGIHHHFQPGWDWDRDVDGRILTGDENTNGACNGSIDCAMRYTSNEDFERWKKGGPFCQSYRYCRKLDPALCAPDDEHKTIEQRTYANKDGCWDQINLSNR